MCFDDIDFVIFEGTVPLAVLSCLSLLFFSVRLYPSRAIALPRISPSLPDSYFIVCPLSRARLSWIASETPSVFTSRPSKNAQCDCLAVVASPADVNVDETRLCFASRADMQKLDPCGVLALGRD